MKRLPLPPFSREAKTQNLNAFSVSKLHIWGGGAVAFEGSGEDFPERTG